LGLAQAAHADLIIDVRGVRGTNQSTWTFSGVYVVGDVLQTADVYSLFSALRTDDDNINNFNHETGDLTGDIGVATNTFNLQDFGFLSSTAQVSGSLSGPHALDGIFLDSDDPATGDDIAWYATGTFQDGETLTFSGTATIAIDMNLLLVEGVTFRDISSQAGPSGNPTNLYMTFGAESATDPSAQIEALASAVDALESDGDIGGGVATSLLAKLDQAGDQTSSQPEAAIGMLSAFVRQVTALVLTGHLDFAEGQALIVAAQAVIDTLLAG
jgi:hypothetical protein